MPCIALSQTTTRDSLGINTAHIKDSAALLPRKQTQGDTIFTKDITDIIQRTFDILRITKGNGSVKKYHRMSWSVMPFAGYSLQTGFAGGMAASAAFCTDSIVSNQRVSSILTSFTYTEHNQIILPFQATVWFRKNTYQLITDLRYESYPSLTYGLGNNTPLSNGYYINFQEIKIHESLLRKVATNLLIGGGYYLNNAWSIKEVDPPTPTSFQKYTNNNVTAQEVASGFILRLRYDNRQNPIAPQRGWFVDATYRNDLIALESSVAVQSLQVDVRKYFSLSKTRERILAFWLFEWLTLSGKPNYLFLPSTGWDDSYNTGRGYIQGRYRGLNMHYFEAEYRFQITNNGLLGGVVFANVENFTNKAIFTRTHYSDNFSHIGYGLGIRVKLNKRTNTNLCIDYGFGANGSQGFFVNLGEIF